MKHPQTLDERMLALLDYEFESILRKATKKTLTHAEAIDLYRRAKQSAFEIAVKERMER